MNLEMYSKTTDNQTQQPKQDIEQKTPAPKQYKVVRNFVKNSEQAALDQVIQKNGLTSKLLEAKHTDKCFIWQERQS